jgi:hypothetical protein
LLNGNTKFLQASEGREEERGKLVGASMGNLLREFDVEQPLRGKNPLTPNILTRV